MEMTREIELERLKEFRRFLDKKQFQYKRTNDVGGLTFLKTAYAVYERRKKELGL